MKLIGCISCGVVLDGDKLRFPDYWLLDDGSVDQEKAGWDSFKDEFVAKVKCPVCAADVLESDG